MTRLAGITATVVVAALASAPAAVAFSPGSEGLGDPFFPKAGNGGYDVANYDLELRYSPGSRRLVATAEITATATQDLSAFDLDFRGPRVTSLMVDGVDAEFARSGPELIVTLPQGIANGSVFRVSSDGFAMYCLDLAVPVLNAVASLDYGDLQANATATTGFDEHVYPLLPYSPGANTELARCPAANRDAAAVVVTTTGELVAFWISFN